MRAAVGGWAALVLGDPDAGAAALLPDYPRPDADWVHLDGRTPEPT